MMKRKKRNRERMIRLHRGKIIKNSKTRGYYRGRKERRRRK